MFLTGQMFAKPWDEPNKPKDIPKVRILALSPHLQDRNYYSTDLKTNLWNNQKLTFSKKIKDFYHEPENRFKCKEGVSLTRMNNRDAFL